MEDTLSIHIPESTEEEYRGLGYIFGMTQDKLDGEEKVPQIMT